MTYIHFLLSIVSFVWYSLWTCVFVVLGSTVIHFIFAENDKYEQKREEAKRIDRHSENHSSMFVANRGRTISTDTHELLFPCIDYRRESLPKLIACSSATGCSNRRRKGRSSMTRQRNSGSLSGKEHSHSIGAVPIKRAAIRSASAPSAPYSSTISSSSTSTSSYSRKCSAQHKTLSTRSLKASLQETLSVRGRRSP